MGKGIDYGMGRANVDHATGIRYGVISQNAILQAWCDSSEGHYPGPFCPDCENVLDKRIEKTPEFVRCDGAIQPATETETWYCDVCDKELDEDEHDVSDLYAEDASSYTLDDGEYLAESCLDSDVIIMRSPYYTKAVFCSPCVPGACSIESPDDDGEKAYCFGPDWFDDEYPCPYPVYNVSDDALVYSPTADAV